MISTPDPRSARAAEALDAREPSVRAPVRVVIVADVRLYRDGLEHALRRDARFDVVGAVQRSPDLAERLRGLAPEVVVLDTVAADALGTAAAILAELPDVRLLGIAVSEHDSQAMTCLEAGFAGYVPHGATVEDLYAAIESVARGELLCSPRVAGTLRRRLASLTLDRATLPDERLLTARERQIARLLGRGLTNKEIARELIIEVATVKNHVHNILEKLRVHRRSDAVARLRGAAPRVIVDASREI